MKEISLVNSDKVALVDDEDFLLVSQFDWLLHKSKENSYAIRNIGRTHVYMHRYVMNLPDTLAETQRKLGKIILVEHLNRNGLDNQKTNLVLSTPSQLGANKVVHRTETSSKYLGVYLDKQSGKWGAGIGHKNKKHHLGYFTNELFAAGVRDKKAIELFGPRVNLNFPLMHINQSISRPKFPGVLQAIRAGQPPVPVTISHQLHDDIYLEMKDEDISRFVRWLKRELDADLRLTRVSRTNISIATRTKPKSKKKMHLKQMTTEELYKFRAKKGLPCPTL